MTVREGSRDSRLPFYRTVRSVGERASEHGQVRDGRKGRRCRESRIDDVEYFELARPIRDHLLDLGLDDIADFNNYAEDEGEDRARGRSQTSFLGLSYRLWKS